MLREKVREIQEFKVDVNGVTTVLKAAFPKHKNFHLGGLKYYYRRDLAPDFWCCGTESSRPTQSVKEFIKQLKTENMDNRLPFKLTEKDAKRIIKIACNSWKKDLVQLWGPVLLEKDYIEIQEPFYKSMREACTTEQNKLFDEIFGKDEEQFSVGDWIYCTERGGNASDHQEFDYNNHFKPDSIQRVIKLDTCKNGYSLAIGHLGGVARVGEYPNFFRKATPEEIAKAQCPYEDGELCWVKRSARDSEWELRYSAGIVDENGEPLFYVHQKNSGVHKGTWSRHKSAKGVELPKD